MWDEKKFFEDYAEESGKIQPDDRFVKQLKAMARQEEKKKPIPLIKYAAAAALVLCVGLGSVVWYVQGGASEDGNKKFETDLQAGTQSGEEAHIVHGQQSSDDPSGEEALTEALDYLRQGAVILDEEENEISQSQQEELWSLLKSAAAADAPENAAREAVYLIEAEPAIEIEIYTDGYIQINGSWYR